MASKLLGDTNIIFDIADAYKYIKADIENDNINNVIQTFKDLRDVNFQKIITIINNSFDESYNSLKNLKLDFDFVNSQTNYYQTNLIYKKLLNSSYLDFYQKSMVFDKFIKNYQNFSKCIIGKDVSKIYGFSTSEKILIQDCVRDIISIVNNNKSGLSNTIDEYKKCANFYNVVLIHSQAKSKIVSIVLPAIVDSEIYSHVEGTFEYKKAKLIAGELPDHKKYNLSQINSIIKEYELLNIEGKAVDIISNTVDTLIRKGLISKENRLGEYADDSINMISCVTGYPVLTNNVDDYKKTRYKKVEDDEFKEVVDKVNKIDILTKDDAEKIFEQLFSCEKDVRSEFVVNIAKENGLEFQKPEIVETSRFINDTNFKIMQCDGAKDFYIQSENKDIEDNIRLCDNKGVYTNYYKLNYNNHEKVK